MSGGEGFTFHDRTLYAEQRTIMLQMGYLYRKLKETYADRIQIDVIDPRNAVSYFSILAGRAYQNRMGWRKAIRSMIKGFNTIAVFVEGEPVATGKVPNVEIVKEKIDQILHQKESG